MYLCLSNSGLVVGLRGFLAVLAVHRLQFVLLWTGTAILATSKHVCEAIAETFELVFKVTAEASEFLLNAVPVGIDKHQKNETKGAEHRLAPSRNSIGSVVPGYLVRCFGHLLHRFQG